MTWVAIGPATSPPKQPVQVSSITATAICGSSAGAKPMNQGRLMPCSTSISAVPVLPANDAPLDGQAGRRSLLGDVGHHLVSSSAVSALTTCVLLVGVELVDRAPVRVLRLLEERRLHQLAVVGDRRRRPRPSAAASTSSRSWPIATRPMSIASLAFEQLVVLVVDPAGSHLVVGVVELGVLVEPEPVHVLEHRLVAELLADLGEVGVDRVGEGESMSMSPNVSPPAFSSGDPADLHPASRPLSIVSGCELAGVERRRRGHHLHRRARLVGALGRPVEQRRRLVVLNRLNVSSVARPRSGRNPGIDAITRTAPVDGSIATTEPAPFEPGVEATACCSSCTASRCARRRASS